jgi:formylglycine-generating enzyme required for sulfatase activity
MRTNFRLLLGIVVVFGLTGSELLAVSIEMVTIGNAGNSGEQVGGVINGQNHGPLATVGGVDYQYQIGKYEVTVGQYAQFLRSVAWKNDPYLLYSSQMPIQRSGVLGSYVYIVPPGYENAPINFVWFADAVRFVNWLSNGQPVGQQTLGTTESGSYYINGAVSAAQLAQVTRSPNATWVLPNENEWHKAAYHKNDGVTGNYWAYPTRSDAIDSSQANYGYKLQQITVTGYYDCPSAYGTYDQGGNVSEMLETGADQFSLRGGGFGSDAPRLSARWHWIAAPSGSQSDQYAEIGFRVALVPEPLSGVLMVGCLLLVRRR